MISTRRRLAIASWLGFALAALLLYPLAVALDSDIFYLQWQRRDTLETLAALVLLALVFGTLVFVLWPREGRGATLALGLVAAAPLASFVAGFVRQLPFEDVLISAGESRMLRIALAFLVASPLILLFVKAPDRFARWLRRGLLAVSFVSIVVVESVVAAMSYGAPVIAVARSRAIGNVEACPSVVALLFDELSFAYLYDQDDVRAEYPALRRLSEQATNYRTVRAPANETLVSLPGYLAGRHVADIRVNGMDLLELTADGRLVPFDAGAENGLFATARRLGYRTEMGGYYLPYCSLLGTRVDVCESLSFYNASATREGFSPFNPVRTAFIMWPRQFPFGLVKNAPFADLQRGLVARLAAFAQRPLGTEPVFRFVHFSVPHLPYVFDEGGYNPPFNPLETSPDDAYRRQLRYVDRLVGEIVAGMKHDATFDRTTLVILADHGYRFGGLERDDLHIPFLVKRAGQSSRADVMDAQRGERLLHEVVGQACATG